MLEQKLKKLEDIINGYGQMIVAFSGGVDSTFLLAFAYSKWGDDRVAAMSAEGPYFASDERDYAQSVCDNLGISRKKFDVSHLMPVIEDNPEDRCYHCKKELFTILKEKAEMVGSVLADGTNLDDMKDYRPGHKALQELQIASPLKEAGLTKAEIRQALQDLAESDPKIAAALQMTDKENAMKIWEKPAFACLASRVPYYEKITVEKLAAIAKAEAFLRNKGFTQLRVRCHNATKGNTQGMLARIEILPKEMSMLCQPETMAEINEAFREYGFDFVTFDMGGYKMGSLNGNLATNTPAAETAEAPAKPAKEDRVAVTEEVERPTDQWEFSQATLDEITKFLEETAGKSYSFADFVDVVAKLRAPDGCVWDRAQTHESLKPNFVEEVNEALDAIDNNNMPNFCEELGDVLLQVVLHAQIAKEEGFFTMEDVIQSVSEKMIRRHPHVFGNIQVADVNEQLHLWEEIKRREKAMKAAR